MKNLLPKKRYSTTFGVDPKNVAWRKQRFNAVLNGGSTQTRTADPLRVMQVL